MPFYWFSIFLIIEIMNVRNSGCGNADENMCKSCMVFYASEAYNGLCSACYK